MPQLLSASHGARSGGPGDRYRGEVMPWLLIVVAGLFETGFAVLLKQSANFTRLWPTIGFAACALISFGLHRAKTRPLPAKIDQLQRSAR